MVSPRALLVDLYELTMAQSYLNEGMEGLATFSLFVRQLPPGRGYLVAAGLEDALGYLEQLEFAPDDLAYLEETGLFTQGLLHRLADLRFTGSVRAVPEGTICFANEPLLEVTAPIIEAQVVETILINELQLQTMIATKAARCASVAGGRSLVDFALRRTHGSDAGLKVARASFIGGFDATSNVLAGQRYGIPIAGTMAHSYVEAFPQEIEAFRAYARAYPDSAVLLVDTYDPMEGARRAAAVGAELATQGHQLRGVRLDSGDLASQSRQVRAILDEAGLTESIVFASGALDEYAIERLLAEAASIDGFGVGTRLGVSDDAPHLDIAYKLVSYDGRPTLKLSADKTTWPGAKQAWRQETAQGPADWLGPATEPGPAGSVPLLQPFVGDGTRLKGPEPLQATRARCHEGLSTLPAEVLRLRDPIVLEARPTEGLIRLQERLAQRFLSPHPPQAEALSADQVEVHP